MNMLKRVRDLSPANFLKLLFAFFSVAFLVAAVFMPDRNAMFSGLWEILSQPSKVSTNYFAVGGYAATFLNMGLVCLICTALYCLPGVTVNNVSTLAFLLTAGFCSWGINILNIWPTVLGVVLYCLVKKEKLGANVNAMLFSTGIAPLISDLLVRHPYPDVVGFNLYGFVVAMIVGIAIGFFLPAGLTHSPKVHKGFDLYSAAVPVCLFAFFLNATLFKTMGIELPAAPGAETLLVASRLTVNLFCCILFGLCIVFALAMGCKPKQYWALLTAPEHVGSVSSQMGTEVFLMNVGVFGLFILAYYNLIGASFNGVTMGIIFCMLCTCNSGSHPGNVWPIMVGYVAASFATKGLCAALGTDCVRTVHRLDAAVGGVMVFARSRMAASILSEQIREHRFQKEYLAVVHGMLPAEGRMQDFLLRDRRDGMTRVAEAGTPGAKEARLSYRVLARIDDNTLVRVALETGRTHQIRVQFSARGHALLGDRKYGLGETGGIALWSCRIGLFHPESGMWMTFSHAPNGIPQFSDFEDCFSNAADV